VLRAPPVVLPYAPEFEPGSAKEGLKLLRALAAVGGGQERLSMTGLFAEAPESEGRVELAPWLVAFALAAMLAEVAVRRFLSAPRVKVARERPAKKAMARGPTAAPVTDAKRSAATSSPAPEEPPEPKSEPPKPPAGVDSALEAARARARRRTGR
ncbi:hypothetical protein HNS30_37420, partial [Corallococcus exercitus]|nr:hypothetical protein [Corallococcus exercitus]